MLYSYIFTLFSQTILPYWRFDIDTREVIILRSDEKYINLVPFRTICEYLSGENYNVSNWIMVSFVNLAGNLAMFIPIGFLMFFKEKNWKITLMTGILISVFIESVQYFVGRASDVDDLLINAMGTAVGWVLAKKLKQLRNIYRIRN